MTKHFEQPKIITEEIEALLGEIDTLLSEGRFQSVEESTLYLRKLYTLLATTNDSRIREMIRYIETEYGV